MDDPAISPPIATRREQMDLIREKLTSVGYTFPSVLQRLSITEYGMWSPTGVTILSLHRSVANYLSRPLTSALDLIIRLLLVNAPVAMKDVESVFAKEEVGALEGMRLIQVEGQVARSAVSLFECEGLFIATDSFTKTLTSVTRAGNNIVMPLFPPCYQLAAALPKRKAGKLLDLCTGSGLYALLGSRWFSQAYGVDINRRAIAFANFNKALNAIDNVEFHEGDLFQNLELRFDAIVANPPFIPATNTMPSENFYSGGRRGDAIIVRILSGLQDHLANEGLCQIIALLPLWKDQDIESWLRQQIEGDGANYSIVVLANTVPLDMVLEEIAPLQPDAPYLREKVRAFQWGIVNLHRTLSNRDGFFFRTSFRLSVRPEDLFEMIRTVSGGEEDPSKHRNAVMSSFYGADDNFSREQQTIRAKCLHPSGTFVEFRREEVEQSITDRFDLQVAKYAGRIAVRAKDQALTYNALNKMANRVACAILAQCGEGNEPVAFLLEQSGAAIAAVLGVLKAGKIYVPLDPSYPRPRLTAILEDSQASLILTDSRNLSLAKELASGGPPLLKVDELDVSLSTQNLGLSISPDAVAAIFYTSGSTGQPKGVMQSHRSVLHRVMIDTNNFHICPDDRLSLLSSPTYSVSLRNLFGALLNGAALCPFDIEEEGLVHLADWLIQEKITIYFSVPTVFRHFTDSLTGQKDFSMLRLIYLAGEPAIEKDVEVYKKHFSPDCIFVNSLASNEAGIIRQHFIDKETQINGSVVPGGYEVDGKEILVLNDAGQEVGCNEVGEIAVKSRYLSPGYWRKPDLTAAAFPPDPQGGDGRIYLTGDLGRMLPDGCLIHLGRKDSRVKIRGITVEVAEIEMALLEHPAVKEVVVLARQDQLGDKCLVAYVVPAGHPAATIYALRRALAEKLPDYMVPSAFIFLDALPVTPNGKVDRVALPAPGHARPELEVGFMAARTRVEDTLTGFWAEALGLDQVGIHDDFFELGGHSLLAIEVISRINDAFNVNLSLASLYVTPTVAELAITVMQGQAE